MPQSLLQQKSQLKKLADTRLMDGAKRLLIFGSILFLTFQLTYGQGLQKFKQDTLTIDRFEYAELSTPTGGECICYVSNPDSAQEAIIASIGAAADFKFDNDSLFNGKHVLQPKQQLIAIYNFKGSTLRISNVSAVSVKVLVSLLCPKNN